MSIKESIEAFGSLGFTKVEAEVYVYLIKNSPATGYAIANAINRTKGATYKTLRSLESRGALIFEGSTRRLCRAIPPDEFLNQLEKDFYREKGKVLDAIKDIRPSPTDERIYQLTKAEQVYERSRKMLKECTTLAVIDIFPAAYNVLAKDIRETASRGVRIAMTVYEPLELEGVWISLDRHHEKVLEYFPVIWITLCTDATKLLMAAISKDNDEVLNGFWTEGLLFSWATGSYLKQNVIVADFERLIMAGGTAADMRTLHKKWDDFLPSFLSPGSRELQKLIKRFYSR